MKRYFYVIAIILLIVIFEFFYVNQINTNNELKTRRDNLRKVHLITKSIEINDKGISLIGETFNFFDLIRINNVKHHILDKKVRLKVVILVNIDKDCGSCLSEYRLWNQLQRKHGLMDVEMSLVGFNHKKEDLLTFADKRNIQFSVFYDERNEILKTLSLSRTPVKILLDKSNKILSVEKCTSDFFLYRKYIEDIEKRLSLL